MVLKFRKQKFGIFLIVALVFILILSFASAVYTRAYVQNNPFVLNEADIKSEGTDFRTFDSSMCRDGQDFVLNVLPFGCTPSVVRSDLLEEQDVTVYCKISATQINPLIEVDSIDRIILTGQYPKEVATVGYFPARAALGRFGSLQINQPILENIGYAAITLRRNPNESSMPDFVEGNLTARIRYDIDSAFGIGKSVYYLPEFSSDFDFQNRRNAYSFWNGKGYLRAEGITNEGAIISVYSGRSFGSFSGGEPVKIANLNLRKGEKSSEIFMPGFNFCQGGLTVKLNNVEAPTTRARFNVNGNSFEAKKGEKFLDGRCRVKKIEKRGLNKGVSLSCDVDEGDGTFDLIINPGVRLNINGVEDDYGLGEKIPFINNPDKIIFVGYIGTKKGTNEEEDLYVRFIETPKKNLEKLTDAMLSEVARFDGDDSNSRDSSVAGSVVDFVKERVQDVGQWIERGGRRLLQGTDFAYADVDGNNAYGSQVSVLGFAGAKNVELSQNAQENYNSAKSDYEEIINSFSEERYPDSDEDELTLGEDAFRNLIALANDINQKQDVLVFCPEFEEKYPEVELPIGCVDSFRLSDTGSSVNEILIDNKIYRISLEGIVEPSTEEYGAEILIANADSGCTGGLLGEDGEACFSDTEFIKLMNVEDDYAEFEISVKESLLREGFLKTTRLRIELGDFRAVGKDGYRITLININLKKVASVSVNPTIRNAETFADFNFKIGIDKRVIQLSPEKINEKLQSTTERLEKLRGVQSKLEPVVEVFETACKAASLALTLKTFLVNLDGEGIARQKVMRGEDGWFDRCRKEVETTKKSIDSCLLDHNSDIGKSVEEVKTQQDRINREMKVFQEGIIETSFLGEDVVNTTALIEKCVSGYREELSSNLQSGLGPSIKIVGASNPVSVSEILGRVDKDTVSITQCRDLQLNSRLLSSENEVVRDIAEQELKASLNDIYINTNEAAEIADLSNRLRDNGFGGIGVGGVFVSENAIEAVYDGFVTSREVGDVPEGVSLTSIIYNNNDYLVQLEKVGLNYRIIEIYDPRGIKVDSRTDLYEGIQASFVFKHFDASTYKNPFVSSDYKVRYYEHGNYKGLPAIVPFDKENGWYASVKSTLPVFGNIRSFDDSGRVSSFYLCNVGDNGKAEFNSGFGDDFCQGINLGTGQPYNVFPGLSSSEASKQINRAVRALEQASKQHSPGIQSVRITIPGLPAQNIPVGEPAVNIPDIQCQDFMSPFECNLLFNACDPIICPSSRCDFGGAYPVADVVQSGIGGSLLLCLPNFPEVIVPICLSGVQAGLQGWESVLESYQQCLQTSSDTGQTVGICDEINSVYQCDLLWRQVAPIAQVVVPKLTGKILGQGTRGGGEYLGAQDAFDRARNSADFYRNYYTDNANAAFRARSLQETAVGAVCRNSLSAIYPGAELFDNLISADSPPQFYGRFDEIPFTTVTNPPTSQYKVFYHIFAGKDFGASYQVYLKGSGGSFFQDTLSRRIVASDFIPAGGYHTDAADFTAPSGYNQMCIVVNGQEECGFKEVTTEFAFTYVRDQYVRGQLEQTEIKSERECISGTLSAYSLLNPNIQAGAEDFIDPQIYNQGITRICATNSPGKGSDPGFGTASARWQDVGHCGNEGLKCWLDKRSIQTAVESFDIEDELLEDFESRSLNILRGEVEDPYDFDVIAGEVKDARNEPLEVIEIVSEIIDKVFFNREKAYLHLLRGNAFRSLAFESFIFELPSSGGNGGDRQGEPGIIPGTIVIPSISSDIENAIKNSDSSNLQYPVFKFDNGKPGGDLYYVYSEGNWFWSENKEKWINSQLSSFENSDTQNSNFAQQDVTRFVSDIDLFERQNNENKNFIRSLVGESYSQGLNDLIGLTRENDGGARWDLREVPSKLSTESVGFSPDGIFKVKISAISYPLEYSFEEKEWKHTLLFPGERVPREIVDLIEALDGESFIGGAEIIFSIDSSSNVIEEETGQETGEVKECDSCGDGFGYCDRQECEVDLGCKFVNGVAWFNECIEKEGTSQSQPGVEETFQSQSCSSIPDCQKTLGKEIIRIANEIQASEEGSGDFDVQVRADTGAESFECLVLQIAFVESRIQQCGPVIGEGYQIEGNPLYCDNNFGTTLGGDEGNSWGIMQINLKANPGVDVTNFKTNVRFGVNHLIGKYNLNSRDYVCTSESYSGWQRALRGYNGWSLTDGSPDCYKEDGTRKGNWYYVSDITRIKDRDDFIELFPECEDSSVSPGQVAEIR